MSSKLQYPKKKSKVKIDNDRKKRILDYYPTFGISEIARMYNVTPQQIAVIVNPITKEKAKKTRKKYLDKLKKLNPDKIKEYKEKASHDFKRRYKNEPELREWKKISGKESRKKYDLKNKTELNIKKNHHYHENKQRISKRRKELYDPIKRAKEYSIKSGKFIRDFFRSLE